MNVLIVSPCFAPYTGVGALRMSSLAEYLAQQGERVTVLKARDADYPDEMTGGERVAGIREEEFLMPGNSKDTWDAFGQKLDALCACERYDVCVASFGPFNPASYLTAAKMKYAFPLVIEFRDLWAYDTRMRKGYRDWVLKYYVLLKNSKTERKLIECCNHFVTVTPQTLKEMLQHYPELKQRSSCIYNGYTMSEPPAQSEMWREGVIRLCITGKFSYISRRGAYAFMDAIKALREESVPIELIHIGTPDAETDNYGKLIGLPEDAYREMGQLPYSEAMKIASEMHVCVANADFEKGLGTKIFDYIYLNKPIIAFVPPHSEIEALLSEAENAYFCQTSEQIEAAIHIIIREKQTCLTENEEFRNRFSREKQNEAYRTLLKEIVNKRE